MKNPIDSEESFKNAVNRLYELANNGFEENSAEAIEYSVLKALTNDYQQKNHPISESNERGTKENS